MDKISPCPVACGAVRNALKYDVPMAITVNARNEVQKWETTKKKIPEKMRPMKRAETRMTKRNDFPDIPPQAMPGRTASI
jgi:hypothetical protein